MDGGGGENAKRARRSRKTFCTISMTVTFVLSGAVSLKLPRLLAHFRFYQNRENAIFVYEFPD